MLSVRGLDVFHGRVQALRGVDLDVRRGELVTLVGPNGAGKTTLLRAITGLLPVRAGAVTFDGVPIAGAAPETIVRRGISMVPEGRELFGPLSVRENLLLGGHARPAAERPRLLLLDEPSVGLAPLVVRDIFAVLDVLRTEGLTMLLVEQNARAAFRIADRGYVLRPGGRIAAADAGAGSGEAARSGYGLALITEEVER